MNIVKIALIITNIFLTVFARWSSVAWMLVWTIELNTIFVWFTYNVLCLIELLLLSLIESLLLSLIESSFWCLIEPSLLSLSGSLPSRGPELGAINATLSTKMRRKWSPIHQNMQTWPVWGAKNVTPAPNTCVENATPSTNMPFLKPLHNTYRWASQSLPDT